MLFSQTFLFAFLSALLLDLISLVGIFTLKFRREPYYLLVFATSMLLALVFLHILPEIFSSSFNTKIISSIILLAILIYFSLERYLHWRHCHKDKCEVHPATYLISFGDAIHNFLDGLVLYFTYAISPLTGAFTTIAFLIHEIPQEVSDFIILRNLGFGTRKAILWNLLVGLFALLGVFVGLFIGNYIAKFQPLILAFVAGGFLYVSMSDLIPFLHEEPSLKKATLSLFIFLLTFLLVFVFS